MRRLIPLVLTIVTLPNIATADAPRAETSPAADPLAMLGCPVWIPPASEVAADTSPANAARRTRSPIERVASPSLSLPYQMITPSRTLPSYRRGRRQDAPMASTRLAVEAAADLPSEFSYPGAPEADEPSVPSPPLASPPPLVVTTALSQDAVLSLMSRQMHRPTGHATFRAAGNGAAYRTTVRGSGRSPCCTSR